MEFKLQQEPSMHKKGFSAHLAKNILTYYGINFPPQIKLDSRGSIKDNFELDQLQNTNKNLNIIPNPSNGQFVVHWSAGKNQKTTATLTIYDVTGKLVLVKAISPFMDEPIDMSNQTNGIYFYQLTSDNNQTEFGKIVVQK